jgi:hypothetical protein
MFNAFPHVTSLAIASSAYPITRQVRRSAPICVSPCSSVACLVYWCSSVACVGVLVFFCGHLLPGLPQRAQDDAGGLSLETGGDKITFNPVANPGSGTTIFQVSFAYTEASNTFDPGGRPGQLVFRLNW